MRKDRFIDNLFPNLSLSMTDKTELQALVSTFIDEHLLNYAMFADSQSRQVDMNRWKQIKTRDNVRLYSERESKIDSNSIAVEPEASNMPVILCEGSIPGKLEDVMFGVINPTLDLMRLKASYVDDISSASVLATIVEPTPADPLQSLVLKWMQLDLPLSSMNLVKNRDFVYMEATGIMQMNNGERIGYHIQHSIELPHAPKLPGLVRGNCRLCTFFRQDRELTVEIYATGACEPEGPVLKSLLLQPISSMLLACTEYAHCGEMKKVAWIMQHCNAQKEQMNAKRKDDKCVYCSSPVYHSRMSKSSSVRGSCRLCFNAVCRSCRVRKDLTFMEPDFKYEKRKVTFCPVCIKQALNVSALQVARDQTLVSKTRHTYHVSSDFSTTSSSEDEGRALLQGF